MTNYIYTKQIVSWEMEWLSLSFSHWTEIKSRVKNLPVELDDTVLFLSEL